MLNTLRLVIAIGCLPCSLNAQSAGESGSRGSPVPTDGFGVVLLGSGAGPLVNLKQYGASTLVEAGGIRLLFDCGRGATLRLAQIGVPVGSISRLFLTHLHSDHVIQIPDLLLTGWAGGGRACRSRCGARKGRATCSITCSRHLPSTSAYAAMSTSEFPRTASKS